MSATAMPHCWSVPMDPASKPANLPSTFWYSTFRKLLLSSTAMSSLPSPFMSVTAMQFPLWVL
jgi:hypothetical protein